MNIRDISRRLSNQAETVAEYLLPNGKREGNYWRTGSVDGAAGRSLKVQLSGEKAGRWMDHADDHFHGDLIDLWMATRHLNLPEALKEVKDYLGIRDAIAPAVHKPFVPPQPKPGTRRPTAAGPVESYLVDERQLDRETLARFKVAETDGAIVLPYLKGEERQMIKYIGLDRSSGKKVWTSKGGRKTLFGWQALDPNARTVVITEGEIDAMTLAVIGINALSIPYGAGSQSQSEWIENDYDDLDRFDEILIWMDDDEAGRNTAREIAERLGIERTRIVQTPGGHNDINEAWTSGLDAECFHRALQEAEAISPEALRMANEYLADVSDIFYPPGGHEPGYTLGWDSMDELVFRPAELIIVSGFNGHGKSQLAGQILLEGMGCGKRACIASLEMPVRRVLARLMKQAGGVGQPTREYLAEINNWFADKLWVYDHLGRTDIDQLLQAFTYAKKRFGVEVFLIDSLMMLGIATDDYQGQKEFVQRIVEWKMANDATVFLVAHSRKQASEEQRPSKLDVRGAGEITDMADTVLTVWRDKREDRVSDGMVACSKQRNGESEPSTSVWFDVDSNQFRPGSTMPPFRHVNYSKLKVAS